MGGKGTAMEGSWSATLRSTPAPAQSRLRSEDTDQFSGAEIRDLARAALGG